MRKNKYTTVQKRILLAIVKGAKIMAYTPKHGRQCFKSDEDGLRAVLYLSLTMRALRDKGAVLCIDNTDCMITEEGYSAISNPLPVEY